MLPRAAMVTRMDYQVGRVLAALDRLGLARDTVVVFTSDNGGERFSDNWPFTGRKTELLEGGLRVPAIVRWPARLAHGTVTGQVAMSMDWMPTLLACAGAGPSPSATATATWVAMATARGLRTAPATKTPQHTLRGGTLSSPPPPTDIESRQTMPQIISYVRQGNA